MNVKRIFPLTAICACLATAPLAFAVEPVRDLADILKLETKVESVTEKVMPATVALLSSQTGSSGSGVITTPDGLILTAAHVIQGADVVEVVFPNGEQTRGKVLGANYSKDIAMVQILKKGPWPFVERGNSRPLAAGDWVIAMGHSAGFDAARTPPVRFGRVVSKGPGNFLTTDCTLIGGDSGGPLFDLDGKIVGINSSIGFSFTNNNHAGVDGFEADWDRLKAGEAWGRLSMDPFANPEMPSIGIIMGLPQGTEGVRVLELIPQSPAGAAGVRIGDIIQTLDGRDIPDGWQLRQLLAKRQPGDKVKLGLLRDNRTVTVEVVLSKIEDLFRNQ